MKNLMYAEIELVTDQMKNDSKCTIISDGALFLVTTVENTGNYPDEHFEITDEETMKEYNQ